MFLLPFKSGVKTEKEWDRCGTDSDVRERLDRRKDRGKSTGEQKMGVLGG